MILKDHVTQLVAENSAFSKQLFQIVIIFYNITFLLYVWANKCSPGEHKRLKKKIVIHFILRCPCYSVIIHLSKE